MPFVVPEDINPGVDLAEVGRALAALIPADKTFELRSLPVGRSWVGRDIKAALEAVPNLATGTGLYYMLNPVRPDLKGAAKNDDITERVRLLVDVDSVRPNPDLPATDAEKREAAVVAQLVLIDLKSRGCPDPAVIDSGNGYQLVYCVDLPNDELAHKWVSLFLKRLADLYDSAGAKVDVSVHNAGRLARLPGTWNRKGQTTPDRPHRMARIERIPERFEPIPMEVFRELVGPEKANQSSPRLAPWTVPVQTAGQVGAWFRKAFEGEAGKVAMAPEGSRHNTLRNATMTLAGYIHHGQVSEPEIIARMTEIGLRNGLGEKDVKDAVAWGVENGKANPLPWPERLTPPRPAFVPGASSEETTGLSGRSYKFPLIVKGSDVTPRKVSWLWPDRIPYGFLTLMAGRTGVGKSFVTLDMAARLTTGDEIPVSGGECFERCNVLIISEDSHDFILAPRLIEAGADMGRVAFMSWEAMATYTLADTEMLDDTYQASGQPKLVVIDPPTNFLGNKDEHKNAEVRSVLMNVSIWAMKHDVACVLITHCNKGVKKDMAALDRVIGSVAWASTSRIAHLFASNPDDPSQGVFLPLKSNIGMMPEGITYEIERTDTLARVKWLSRITFDADEALGGEKKPRGVAAVEWLIAKFREQREWRADLLKADAAEAGVSKNALWSPEVNALPIDKKPVVGADGEKHWYWRARPDWPPEVVGNVGNLGKVAPKSSQDNTHLRFPKSDNAGNLGGQHSQDSQHSHFPDDVSRDSPRDVTAGRAERWLVLLLNSSGGVLPADTVIQFGRESGFEKAVLENAVRTRGVFGEEVKNGVIHWFYREEF